MESIAIIGIGCRFATAKNATEFFDLLKKGVDATTEIPADRWNVRSFYDPDRRMPGKLTTYRGGFLPRVDAFDARFFGISPREAACMDPQQRLLLEVSWEAMEDAGLIPEQLAGKDVGVYVGGFTLDYKTIQLGYLNRRLMDTTTATGSMMTMLSNRLSHAYDFRGPSMSIDTACSSSLVAVHLACGSLRNGECSVALAGGVNIMVLPEFTIAESKGGFLSPDGRSKPFSATANGYGRAEGAGIVILKKLSAAIADGDPIYAVIRGSAVNQDGHTDGITVPSSDAQTRLILDACRNAGVEAGEIQYVEAHGTGTPVGDPIEARALSAALGTGRAKGSRCIVGSVKGNIGHSEAAAGVAGLIKASMSMQNREIPPSLHSDQPNPSIPFDQLSIRIATSLESWPASGGRMLAGVNSFGFGGTNAHAILEQAPDREEPVQPAEESGNALVFPVSARSPEALNAAAQQLRDFARSAGEQGIAFRDMFYSAAFRRSHHDHRLGVVARSNEELAELLDAHLAGETRAGVAVGAIRSSGRPRLVFVCTGMGPQWWAMGRQLFASEPVFRQAIEQCDEIFQQVAGWSLLQEMMAEEAQSHMAETWVAQPANFAIQTALAALWKSWGIQPDAIVGHSVGEVSASYLAGALSLEDAVRVSFHRSRLQQTTAGRGAMLAVGLPAEEAMAWIEPYHGRISPAAVNSPTSLTLAGDKDAIRDLSERLTAKEIFNRPLRVNIAYHSAQMDPLQKELLEVLDGLAPRQAAIPLYSTVTGERMDGVELNAGYWWRNVREPVRFAAAMDTLIEDAFDCFIEVGPHPVLASSIRECLTARRKESVSLSSIRREEDERQTMLNALASLYSAGFPVRWETFQSASARFVRLPSYPWQRERYWSESEESVIDRIGVAPHPLLTRPVNSARPTWDVEINTRLLPYLQDHAVGGSVVFPGAGYVEMALAAGKEVFGAGDTAVEDIRFHRALFLPEGERPRSQITVDADNGAFEIHTRNESGGWVRNAAGRLAQRCGSEPAPLDADEIQARCVDAFDKADCYQRFAAQGFQYGPAFQKINRICIGEGEALAWFDEVDETETEYQLHPAFLDACLQSLVATDPFGGDDGAPSKSYMPVGISKIRVWRRPQGRMWAWARLTQRDESGATGSIVCCDAGGAVVVEILDLEVKALDAASGSLSRERMDQNLYNMRWIAAARESAPAAAEGQGCWAVLADATGAADRLAERLGDAGASVVMVRPGAEYEFQMESRSCTLNPEVPDHFTQLLQDIEAAGSPLMGVAHMWNLDLNGDPQSPDQLTQAETRGALSMLHLVQAVVQSGATPRIWAVTRGAQVVGVQSSVNVAQAPVWGIGRVAGHQEHISIWGGLIDLDPAASADEIDTLFVEMTQPSEEDQIAFRAGERHVVRLQRCSDLTAALPVRLRPDASYLITGAFGALGLLTARWMVERGARRLILMGRSSLPERARWDEEQQRPDVARKIAALRELESMGATVVVAPVDVADEAQLGEFLRQYEQQGWPAIRGVIHSAGLVRDQLLAQMDAQSFRDVLRPKVHGAWNLHRMLMNAPLDFFVLYSSIGSIVAQMGQANYASANSFLDTLAQDRRRRGLPALSINWGPWAVGMVNDLNLAEHYASRGLDVITAEHGMAYLARLLGQRNAGVAVLSANWGTMAEYQSKVSPMTAHLAIESRTDSNAGGESGVDDFLSVLMKADPADQSGLMEQHLRSLTARVLRMDPEKVDATAPLSALGLDSMMAMELKNRLDLSLGMPVPMLDLLKGASISELAPDLLARLIEEDSEIQQMLEQLEQSSETSEPAKLPS